MKDKLIQWFLRERQMSEAFINSIFLAMSGGFQDAYTYFARGGVILMPRQVTSCY